MIVNDLLEAKSISGEDAKNLHAESIVVKCLAVKRAGEE